MLKKLNYTYYEVSRSVVEGGLSHFFNCFCLDHLQINCIILYSMVKLGEKLKRQLGKTENGRKKGNVMAYMGGPLRVFAFGA